MGFRVFRALLLGMVGLYANEVLAEDPQMYRSAHYATRGNTGIGDADDQEAIFYNPAGLAQGDGIYKRFIWASPQVEISSRTRTIYNRLEVEEDGQAETLKEEIGKPLHLGVSNLSALVFRRAALGAYFDADANVMVRKHPDYDGLETLSADYNSNRVLTFSIAEGFFDNHLLIGGTGKYIARQESSFQANIIDAQQLSNLRGDEFVKSGTGRGADLGLMLKTGRSKTFTEQSIGVTVVNVGGVKFTPDPDSNELNELPQTLNLGYTLSLGTKYSRMKFLADYRDVNGAVESNPLKRIHLGSEINFANFIGLMGGFNQGYPTAGLFTNFYLMRIDVGMYTQEMGERVGTYPDQRYVLRITTGI